MIGVMQRVDTLADRLFARTAPPSHTFFVSDTHFGHENIITFTKRPFRTIAEMDEVMIENWNNTVGDNDLVYHLGDLCMGGPDEALYYLSRLNGRILILPGNHDTRWFSKVFSPSFANNHLPRSRSGHVVQPLKPLLDVEFPAYGRDGRPRHAVLCHYPLVTWNKKHHGAWHLYGHVHNNNDAPTGLGLALNMSVECIDYRPIALEAVAAQLLEAELEMET